MGNKLLFLFFLFLFLGLSALVRGVEPPAHLVILHTGDTNGYIEPCG